MDTSGIHCPNCQTVNRPGARFCAQCRTPLEPPAQTASNNLTGPATSPAMSFEVPPAPPRSSQRSWTGIIVVGVILVAVLVAAGYWYMNLRGLSRPEQILSGGVPAISTTSTPTPTMDATTTIVATTPSAQPTSTSTPTRTVTATATPSPTPLPDAQVIVESANLRAGPGVVFDIISVLKKGDALAVIGRNLTGEWLQVQAPAKMGWVAISLVQLNIPLGNVPVAKLIPTPPPAPPPAMPPMSGNQGCPPSPVRVSIINQSSATLLIILQGSQNYLVPVSPGQSKNVCLAKGPYQFMTSAMGGNGTMDQGIQMWMSDAPTCWFVPSAGVPSACNAPTDPNTYTLPLTGEMPMPQGSR